MIAKKIFWTFQFLFLLMGHIIIAQTLKDIAIVIDRSSCINDIDFININKILTVEDDNLRAQEQKSKFYDLDYEDVDYDGKDLLTQFIKEQNGRLTSDFILISLKVRSSL